MSNLKCPFCGGEMIGSGICHYNPDCPIYDNPVPIEVLDLLDRTRKALDVAVKAMESAKYFRLEHCMCCGHDPQKDAVYIKLKKALEQITALEQKD